MPPIERLAEARAKVFYDGSKEEANDEMHRLWQTRWDVSDVGRWTHVLIPKVKEWVCRSHGDLSYHMTEFLTGHGPFRTYLFKIGKSATDVCQVCDVVDTPAYTVLHCVRWDAQRWQMIVKYPDIREDNFVENMLQSQDDWAFLTRVMDKILADKDLDP